MDKNELVKTCVACGKCQGYELFASQGVPDGLDCETARKWAESGTLRNNVRSNVEADGKLYHVYYGAKFNGTQQEFVLDVRASSAREACAECKRLVFKNTGRNAFTPQAVLSDKRPKWYSEAKVRKGYPPPKM
jgi:hypothetical protein